MRRNPPQGRRLLTAEVGEKGPAQKLAHEKRDEAYHHDRRRSAVPRAEEAGRQ